MARNFVTYIDIFNQVALQIDLRRADNDNITAIADFVRRFFNANLGNLWSFSYYEMASGRYIVIPEHLTLQQKFAYARQMMHLRAGHPVTIAVLPFQDNHKVRPSVIDTCLRRKNSCFSWCYSDHTWDINSPCL